MALASLKDLYFDELADLYDAETQIVRTLPRLVDAARAPELREALKKHCDESRLHLERLELIFTHWGERRRSSPCAGLTGIVQEADERLHEAATEDVRDAAIIGAAQRIEHYEIAAYGCARRGGTVIHVPFSSHGGRSPTGLSGAPAAAPSRGKNCSRRLS